MPFHGWLKSFGETFRTPDGCICYRTFVVSRAKSRLDSPATPPPPPAPRNRRPATEERTSPASHHANTASSPFETFADQRRLLHGHPTGKQSSSGLRTLVCTNTRRKRGESTRPRPVTYDFSWRRCCAVAITHVTPLFMTNGMSWLSMSLISMPKDRG